MYIGVKYEQVIKMKKEYEGTVSYRLKLVEQSDTRNIKAIVQGKELSKIGDSIKNEISQEGDVDIKLEVSSDMVGENSASFLIEIEDGEPLSFGLKAEFRGPLLMMSPSIVDFDLVRVNTKNSRVF